jgi:hypothetical protein
VSKGASVPNVSSLDGFRDYLSSVQSVGISSPSSGTDLSNVLTRRAEAAGLSGELRAKLKYVNGLGLAVSKAVAAGQIDSGITLATRSSQ